MSKRDSDGAATEGEGNSRDDGLYPKPKREKGSEGRDQLCQMLLTGQARGRWRLLDLDVSDLDK